MTKSASIFVVSAAAALLSFAPARSFAQVPIPKFEGTITYSIAVPQLGDDKLTMTTNMKGNLSSTTIDMGAMGSQRMYMNRETHTMSMVMGESKTGFTMDIPNDSASAKDDAGTLVPTGKSETVDGYKAQEFTATTKAGSMDIWATADLPAGVRNGMIESMKSNPQSGGSKVFSALFAQGLAPVRITMITGGQTAATVDLVKFDQHSVSDAEVLPPTDVKFTHKTMDDLKHMGGQN